MLSAVALVAVLAIVALAVYAAAQPDEFRVSRKMRIAAAPDEIVPMIADLRRFNTWNPFLRHDPATRITYSGPASGSGAAHEWEGNSQVGKGRVEVVEASARRVTMRLHMVKPMRASNDVEFSLEPIGSGTDVTWTLCGRSNFISKIMGLCMSMDGMVGGEFERGLSDLKRLVER